VPGELLLDTGPLVALLDSSERSHRACVAFYRDWTGPIVTTEAVVTETTHLLAATRLDATRALEFFLRGGALVAPWTGGRLERVAVLMQKYRDVPMDYADATLVALAEELGTGRVLTLDRRGFQTYRWGGKRPFEVAP
jgi:uncharacterized protein